MATFFPDRLQQETETLQPHDHHTSDKNRVFVSLPTEDDGKVEHFFGSSNLNVKMHALQLVWIKPNRNSSRFKTK